MVDARRVPPSDFEAEAAVLGSILIDPDRLLEVSQLVEPSDFYDKRKGQMYALLLDMDSKREPLTAEALKIRMRDANPERFEREHSASHIAEIQDSVPTAANAAYYAGIVSDLAARRSLIRVASEIQERAYQHVDNVDEFSDRCEQMVFNARRKRSVKPYSDVADVVGSVIDRIKAIQSGEVPPGVKTGFDVLDRITGGFKAGELVLLAARPGMGKSSLAVSIARNMVLRGERVGLFSMEVGRESIGANLLAQISRLNSRHISEARVAEGEEGRLFDAADALLDAKGALFLDDRAYQTMATLSGTARRMVSLEGVSVVIVDYLQLITSKGPSRYEAVTDISRALKVLAGHLGVPVVALSQLSRKVEERPDKRPRPSDLRESGSLEQDADQILLLHRPGAYEPENEEIAEDAVVEIAKNRSGPQGRAFLRFVAESVLFTNPTAAQVVRMREQKRGRR